MLRRLTVENFGLIERAEAEFDPGVTIFSGETGSGKTMLVGALAFALGARTAAAAVRPATERAIVTLTFDADETLRERLAADGFALDPGEDGTLVRELTLYDLVGTPGVAADLSHICTPAKVKGFLKDDIKAAVELMFDVKVKGVQVVNESGKDRRFGRTIGRTQDWKKAYVKLKEGEKVPDFAGV